MSNYIRGADAYAHLAANGNTTLSSVPGELHRIVVNKTGSGNTVTVYDNTAASGTVIAVLQPTEPMTLEYDIATSTGLNVKLSGSTPADITVAFQ